MNRSVLKIFALVIAQTIAAAVGPAEIARGEPRADIAKVPGVVIDHIPASTGVYVGSPSIAILPSGDYVASHDHFGPKTTEHEGALTAVFRSADRGKTWKRISLIQGQFWSTLIVHRGALYILGADKHHGNAIIRRSADGGATWTSPKDSRSGLLRDNGQYHCAPMPVIEHAGRLWRAMERRDPPKGWGITYCAGMLSVSVDADLLDGANWTFSKFLPSDKDWLGGTFGGWLEGNAVVTRDGRVVDVLRVDTAGYPEKAAVVSVSADGRTTSFDPATGFVDFPGGAKKFAIRFDPKGNLYWSLATIVPKWHQSARKPGGVRNTLALVCSPDLKKWTVRCILLYHPDVVAHGFQYVDWVFDGDDIIAACRTAYDDGLAAHNNHDANFLTFHRIAGFRAKTMADSVPCAEPPHTAADLPQLSITGHGWELAKLSDGEKAFGNRVYTWKNVPAQFQGGRITRTRGGEQAEILVRAKRDTVLHMATAGGRKRMSLAGWQAVPDAAFHYTDKGQTKMTIYRRAVKAGEEIALPQGNWTGSLLLIAKPE